MERSNKRLYRIANAFYNLGLEKARLNDLTGAAELLKRALRFDKYCTNARNLLGLIYYEMGETADALCQWIVSKNFQPEQNAADRYLDMIQRKPEQLERDSQAIKKFNQALETAQSEDPDFAIIELQHLVSERPKYVKAQIVLAMLYMEKGDNIKAGRALMQVLKVDRNNPTALILMDDVKQATGKAEVEQKKLKNAFSHRKMEDDDVIMPETSVTKIPFSTTMIIILGVLFGMVAFSTLLLPGIRKTYYKEANEKVVENSRKLSSVSSDYSRINTEYEELKVKYDDVSKRLAAFEQENRDFASMYAMLNTIVEEYQNGRYTDATNDWLSIDRTIEILNEEPLVSQLKEVDDVMYNDCYDQLVSLGTQSWNGGKKEAALSYYNLALRIDPDDPEVMYLKARLLQSEDRISEANKIFDKIVGEHPESKYAERAVQARGY